MTLGASLITFSPNTLIRSADVNSNFSAINGVSAIQGEVIGNATSATNALIGTTNLQNGATIGLTVNSSGIITIPVAAGLLDYTGNKYQAWTHFTGTGSGTYSHGWGGGNTPNMTDIDPIDTAADSWATSAGSATTVTVTLSAAVSFNADVSFLQ